MIDMHVGFTGGELRESQKEPSVFRAGLRHLEAIRCLLNGKLSDAYRNEREALAEIARVANRESTRARIHLNEFLSESGGAPPRQIARRVLRRANDLLGEPICSEVEWKARRGEVARAEKSTTVQAPVFLYVKWDSEKTPIEDFFKTRNIAYQVLPVDRDETMLSLIQRETGAEPPAVGIGDKVIAGLPALRRLEETGELGRLLSGQPS